MFPRRRCCTGGKSTDERRREILQSSEVGPGAVPRADPVGEPVEAVERCHQFIVCHLAPNPLDHRSDEIVVVGSIRERRHVNVAAHDCILEVVNRVGDVVGQIHDLSFDAQPPLGRTLAKPRENVHIRFVHAELVSPARVAHTVATPPRILARRVEARAREVQPVRSAGGVKNFRLNAREDTKGLGVSFEPTERLRPIVERLFPVVAEGGVSQIVRETRGID